MIDLIKRHNAELTELCLKYRVQSLELFGSAANDTFDPQRSDLDFLVEFLPEAADESFCYYFDFMDDLQHLFGRNVDLVMPSAIRNAYLLKEINRHRQVLYAA